jgi:lipoate-protein ligase A
MTGVSTCQLIIDPPASGACNMAVDEALLAAAADTGTATLRLYEWEEPTLSLGYFQRYDDRRQHAASLNCAVVRRSSGGGAILHDRELTYSLTLPARLVPDPQALYTRVHCATIELLMRMAGGEGSGWALRLCDRDSAASAGAEPFLCFQRRSCGDVLLRQPADVSSDASGTSEWKILGSAQRRRRGAVLQHGSLLLERSPAAPELPGLGDLTGLAFPAERWRKALPAALAEALGIRLQEGGMSAAVRTAADAIARQKYGAREWSRRR